MGVTHEVTNQVPPLAGHDPIAGDTALVEACVRHADVATLDSLIDDPEVDREFARRMGMRAALFVPLVLGDRAIGVIQAFSSVGGSPGRMTR